MTTPHWHLSDEAIEAYAQGRGGVAATASVEAHLLACAVCRARIATAVAVAAGDTPAIEAGWDGVVAAIARPPEPLALRVLARLGLADTDRVLLAAARSVGGAWTLATLAIVLFSALAAIPAAREGRALYLLVAPLVPVLGVVAAFGSADRLRELAAATPYPKARVALLRALAVAVTSMPLAVLIGLAVPGIAWLAFAWLVPATALTLLALVGMTWWRPDAVGVVVSGAWLAVIAAAYAADDVAGAVRGELQLLYIVVAAGAAAALALRFRAARSPGGYA